MIARRLPIEQETRVRCAVMGCHAALRVSPGGGTPTLPGLWPQMARVGWALVQVRRKHVAHVADNPHAIEDAEPMPVCPAHLAALLALLNGTPTAALAALPATPLELQPVPDAPPVRWRGDSGMP